MPTDLFSSSHWRKPVEAGGIGLFDPATTEVAAGSAADVDLAAEAAQDAAAAVFRIAV